jgi:hypothetical protein
VAEVGTACIFFRRGPGGAGGDSMHFFFGGDHDGAGGDGMYFILPGTTAAEVGKAKTD